MSPDERAIRDLVETWHRATAAGDVETVLTLMDEDVVFLLAGQPAVRGRRAFEQGLRDLLSRHRIESTSDVEAVDISGDLACCWARLTVRLTPRAGGAPTDRSGNALSILRRQPNGAWVVVRDANMLSVVS